MLSFLRRLSVATCASLHPRLRKLCAVPTRRDEPAAPVDQRTPRFRDLSLGGLLGHGAVAHGQRNVQIHFLHERLWMLRLHHGQHLALGLLLGEKAQT